MDTTNGWKVPIPVNIRYNESIDTLSRMLFFEIITLCQNKDTLLHFEHCDKWYSVELKRGQCVLKIAKVAKDLKIGHKRVRKSLETLSKWYSKMESKAMPYGLIVTVIDYDNITQMERNGEDRGKVEGKYRESRGKVEGELIKNVKSVKSVKSVESVKNIYGHFEDFWNKYPRKIAKQKTLDVYNALVLKDSSLIEKIATGIERQLPTMTKQEQRFIPHPTTWLNQGRWDDVIDEKGGGQWI